jgi:hypothetical protein
MLHGYAVAGRIHRGDPLSRRVGLWRDEAENPFYTFFTAGRYNGRSL